MLSTIISVIQKSVMYDNMLAALDEYYPLFADSVKEADEEMAADIPIDVEITAELPDTIHVSLIPGTNLVFDFKSLISGTAEVYDWTSMQLSTLWDSAAVSWMRSVYVDITDWLDTKSIPGTSQLRYRKLITVVTTEPCTHSVEDEGIFQVTLVTTNDPVGFDTYNVYGYGSVLDESITIWDVIRMIAYIHMFIFLYKVAKKTGLLNVARKFAGKVFGIPAVLFSRYNTNKRMAKQTAAIATAVGDTSLDENLLAELTETKTALENLLSVVGWKLKL